MSRKKQPKPVDPAFARDCPRCGAKAGAKAGAKCTNYLGKGKFTCKDRYGIPSSAAGAPETPWHKEAAKKSAKDKEDAGLFADYVEETTAEELYWQNRHNKSRGMELVHQLSASVGGRALDFLQLQAIERYARTVLGEAVAEELRAHAHRVYDNYASYGYGFWQEALTSGNKIVFAWERTPDPTASIGYRATPARFFPPEGWAPPLSREEFWARFPYKEPELGPDDPAGLFARTIGALSNREAAT